MDAMEKQVSSIPSAKNAAQEFPARYAADIQDTEAKLAEMSEALQGMKSEVEELGIQKGGGASQQMLQRMESMNDELGSLQKDLEDVRKRAGRDEAGSQDVNLPSVRDVKKKFEAMQKEFVAIRSKNAQMRQDMLSLHESSEILKSVAESIMGQEDKIAGMRTEMSSLSEDAERLEGKTKEIVSKVKQGSELMERLGDSVDVAKGVLKRFPSQEKSWRSSRRPKAMRRPWRTISARSRRSSMPSEGKQVTSKQFNDIVKKMDERMLQMRKEMDSLETALEDEKGTYLTFQKIKEKVVPSIEAYLQQLSAMQQKIDRIRTDTSAEMENITTEAQKLQQSLGSGEVKEALRVAEEIHEKKKMLDEAHNSLEELVTMSDNLSKRITLLSREAHLLEIRTGGAGPSEAGGSGKGEGGGGGGGIPEQGRAEARTQIGLSQAEELEFRQKREELKKLIQRLWEQ